MSSVTDSGGINTDRGLVRINGYLGGADTYEQTTFREITLTESLLTPGLQTSATFQSQIYGNKKFKDWQQTKNQYIQLQLSDRLAMESQGQQGREMFVRQRVYRLDNREFNPHNLSNVEEMTFHACDDSLLQDAQKLVSKSWKCTTPNEVVNYVLSSCLQQSGTNGQSKFNLDVQTCQPPRDYIAESIHPFQVIAQQANMALDGDDPSFIHYMTYGKDSDWTPIHHFRSLKDLCKQTANITFIHGETSVRGQIDYNNRDQTISQKKNERQVLHFKFPCDYDLLSDLLNGLDENGKNINSVATGNPFNSSGSYDNGNMQGCIRNGNLKISLSNKGTAQQKGGCETDVEKYLLRRQARMALLEKDKVALRLVVAWEPSLHAGDVIKFTWKDKYGGPDLYGTGTYLIASMTHRIQMGGYATTALDCVSTTVGQGIV